MRVSLTKRAQYNYRSIKDHIKSEWGEGVAEAFERKAMNFLDLLEDFPEIGKANQRVPINQANKSVTSRSSVLRWNAFFQALPQE